MMSTSITAVVSTSPTRIYVTVHHQRISQWVPRKIIDAPLVISASKQARVVFVLTNQNAGVDEAAPPRRVYERF